MASVFHDLVLSPDCPPTQREDGSYASHASMLFYRLPYRTIINDDTETTRQAGHAHPSLALEIVSSADALSIQDSGRV